MRLWLLLCVCRGLAEKGSNSGSRGKRGFDVRVIRYVQWFKLWTWLLIMQQWPTLTKHTVRKMLDVDICTCHILKVGNYTVNTKSGKNCFKFICSLVLVGETDQEEKAVIESVLMKCWLNKHMDQWSKEWLAERINKLIRMDGGIDGIAYWTRISVLQWHRRTVFVLSSWCKCLRHILCVCLCRCVCGCACVSWILSTLRLFIINSDLFELQKLNILHAALVGNTLKPSVLYQVEMTICHQPQKTFMY